MTVRRELWFSAALLAFGIGVVRGQPNEAPLTQQRWFETRTAHFDIVSCGEPTQVFKLAGRLEQFCQAYAMLAGAQAVASPPTVVVAFPNHETMKPFLPLYHGQPGNLAGFFVRGEDENLIVLALPPGDEADSGMDVIFHEYAHLLFRRNDLIWPLWLKEGMAEIYSTFETAGYAAAIARPIQHHLNLLARQPMMPLHDLFGVGHDSPQYNESTRQGMFYAESWLLTHYLMAGDNPVYKARFGQFTTLLMAGEGPEQAFTNALGASLPVMEAQLERYREQGVFNAIQFRLPTNVSGTIYADTRILTPVEIYFRLGDELVRIDRPDAAQDYFTQAEKLAPASPLSYEGLGILAAEAGRHDEALRDFTAALQRGSTSFLVHYQYAQEKYRLTADSQNRYAPLGDAQAAVIRSQLQQTLTLMPNFGPGHELFGFFEMVQGDNLTAAEQHLQLAIQLEPENPSYLLTLAQAQLHGQDPGGARRTLAPLLLPNADPKLRAEATAMLQETGRDPAAR